MSEFAVQFAEWWVNESLIYHRISCIHTRMHIITLTCGKEQPRRHHSHKSHINHENPKHWLLSHVGNYKSKGFITHLFSEPLNNHCACKQSNFLYQPLGHVITGDLRVIKNKKLRNLIAKGPNYREQNNIDWDLCHKLMHGWYK